MHPCMMELCFAVADAKTGRCMAWPLIMHVFAIEMLAYYRLAWPCTLRVPSAIDLVLLFIIRENLSEARA